MPFVELHCHTDFSNLRLIDSTNKIDTVIDHAVKLGLAGVAITDHESLSGHIKALNKIHKTTPDFQLILGNEIYLCHDTDPWVGDNGKTRYTIESHDFFHFLLLAKDAVGHEQLRQLSSRAWGRCYSYKGTDRVPTFYSDVEQIVGTNPGHLIASTACLGGEFPKLTLAGDAQGALAFTTWCQKQFGQENFFVELQPGSTCEQVSFNAKAVKFCKHFGLRWIVTNDVHYLSKDKRELHEIFLKSHEEDRETSLFYESTYFKTPEEMIERMKDHVSIEDIEKGFENTLLIGDMCKGAGDYGLFHSTIVPARKLPEFSVQGILDIDAEKYPFIHQFYQSPYQQDLWLMKQLEVGMGKKKQRLNHGNLSRIDIELKQIWKISEAKGQRVSAYYNLTQRIVEIMWNEGNSFVGVARGSVGGWYIAYVMDIIALNPIVHGTYWWRHLHESRPDWPDVDLDSCACRRAQIFEAVKKEFGRDRCLNTITFRTETTKAATIAACSGLGVSNDVARELASLIPISRGHVYTLDECLHGAEDNGFMPVREFINRVSEFPLLLDTIREIEGLVCGRGIHASSLYLMNEPYVKHNSLMKSPNGVDITAFDMHDSDACSALKEDFLTIEALDKMYVCFLLLLEDQRIQWQGSLKATYDRYLHPDVLNYTDAAMWEEAANGEVADLFQMQTDVGGVAIKRIRPHTLKELSLTNAVMRLMGNEDMNPIDRFCSFKNDIGLWYKEMEDNGLTKDEVHVLEKYLIANYGCSIEQEDVMQLVMDEHISGFDMKDANSLRKAIAKKKLKLVEENKKHFFEQGVRLGTRQKMLDYVWKYCIKPSLGYSFSANHDLPYSCIALQEMNLYHFYPHIYWQCAVLSVNASANEENDDNKTTNYGKTATAINNMQNRGVTIALPRINDARFGFRPDADHDRVLFGLKAINGVGDDDASQIIAKRPYTSLRDFYQKNSSLGAKTLITLVKAGCFDSFHPRAEAMSQMLSFLADQGAEPKSQLDFKNFAAVCAMPGFLPERFDFPRRVAAFRSYVCKPRFLVCSKPKTYRLDCTAQIFFENELCRFFSEGVDFYYDDSTVIVYHSKFEKRYKEIIKELAAWLASPDTLDAFNKAQRQLYIDGLRDKYCTGGIPKWEMDSLSFYYTEHELAHVNTAAYNIVPFMSIPENPVVIDTSTRTDRKTGLTTTWDKYQLYRIAGTVLDRDNNKHTIALLTTDGVVTVKLYDGAYAHYNKQISEVDIATGKKTVLEKSWFMRGNKLLITGIRRGDSFFPKKYFDSIYNHTVCLITDVHVNGDLELQLERVNLNE